MTTLKEFREWLNRFPDDTIVQVAIQDKPDPYQSYGAISFESPKLNDSDMGEGWEYVDFTDNQFVKEDSKYFKKKYLKLGESD